MLQVCELNQYYGGSHILRGVSFEAVVGEVTCLLGRNGVGKTTLLRCLMGLIPVKAGEVVWQGKTITHSKPHQRVQSGVAYVPQGGRFSASDRRRKPADGADALLSGKRKERTGGDLAAFPVLKEMKHRRGGDLSGGQQQQLAIGRALASRPQLLILDEPTEGIQPSVIKEIGQVIRSPANRGYGDPAGGAIL
ncbi:ATP-binding cassette domain-containing protein [Enterobacter hormaechei]|uniref:ATP-binding cassette domain-containing protein n=1 Tax=Enterobacter hormaechei TaxID=158836 RepID=A0A4Y5ZUV6_9ENTR|nr:ATP-binding cassette domain-containing protein [Enterobacter hormaechei]